MNNQLVIIGASAMGREACAYARDCGIQVKGFLDDRATILNGFEGYPPVLAAVETYTPDEADVFVCALGDPKRKREYVEMIQKTGGRFISIIHPSAYVGPNVRIGYGCIICPHASISADITIGNHVIVNLNASINHDNVIGDYSTICPGCRLAGRISVGTSAFIGVGASIIPDIKIGDSVFVAAGAVVVADVDSGCVMGNPAKQRK